MNTRLARKLFFIPLFFGVMTSSLFAMQKAFTRSDAEDKRIEAIVNDPNKDPFDDGDFAWGLEGFAFFGLLPSLLT